MSGRHAWLLVLVCVSACQQILGFDDVRVASDAIVEDDTDAEELPTDNGWRSGSRLRLTWNDYEGVRVDLGLEDSQLGVACFSYPWADGKRYCAPRNLTPTFEGVGFLDAACTQPVGYRLRTQCGVETAPVFFTQWTRQDCIGNLRSTVFRRGTLRLGSDPSLYRNDTGSCLPSDFPASSFDLYNLLEEIPPSQLVELSTVLVAIDDRISRVDDRGSDGSSYARGAFDRIIEADCSFSTTGTCVPLQSSADVFFDAGCTMLAAAGVTGCPAPRFAFSRARPDCTISDFNYFEAGALRTPSQLFQAGGTCTATSIQPNLTYYEANTEVTLASPVVEVDPGTTAVVRQRRGSGDERILVGPYDPMNGERCNTYGDRCLPASAAGSSRYFTDAGCTVPIDLALVSLPGSGAGCPAVPVPEIVLKPTTTACATSYRAFAMGAPYSGPLYVGAPGACSASTNPGFALYELGPEQQLSSFPQAQRMTD